MDELVATDDLLVERWHACTICTTRPVTYGGVWAIRGMGFGMAFTLCRRCEADLKASEAVLAKLMRYRYDVERFTTQEGESRCMETDENRRKRTLAKTGA